MSTYSFLLKLFTMENNDKNRDNIFNPLDNNKENIENRIEDNNVLPEDNIEGIPDLDGDGFIGNTGGFYWGTSYLGSNYGPDWNSNQNADDQNNGNFGAAGQSDHTNITQPNSDDESDGSRS